MAVVTVEDLLDHSAVQGVEIFRRPRATHAARKEAVTGEQMGVSVWIVDSEDQRPRGGVSDHVDHTQGHVGECAPIIVMAMRGHDAAQCVAPHEIEDPSRFVCGIDQELFARNGAAQ